MSSGTILFCFAHPDDESFSGAGTAMKCAAAGGRCVIITATRGERGKVGNPAVSSVDKLPAVRERELRDAVAIIGFDELHLLDYRDQELALAPQDEIRRTLVTIIRRSCPDVVLTFDPNGFNLHPDHVAISRFTSDAIAVAADPRWFPDSGAPHVVRRLLWTPPVAPWDAAASEHNTSEIPGIDFEIGVSEWRERRAAALRAHRTQHLSIDRYFFSRPDVERILAREFWRQAWGPPLRVRPSGDIFEGL